MLPWSSGRALTVSGSRDSGKEDRTCYNVSKNGIAQIPYRVKVSDRQDGPYMLYIRKVKMPNLKKKWF